MRLIATLVAAIRVWSIVVVSQVQSLPRSKRGRSSPDSLDTRIREAVLALPGITVAKHRFGGIEFRLGRRELGHLHGGYLADLPFPVRVREQLVAEGRAFPHHILPLSGWVSYPIRDERDLPGVVALFQLAYDRAQRAQRRRQEESAVSRPKRDTDS